MRADKGRTGERKSWWPWKKERQEYEELEMPTPPHLEWDDVERMIGEAQKTISQVGEGMRLIRRKTLEYNPDQTIVETVRDLNSNRIVRTEYNQDWTVRSRQVYTDTEPPPLSGNHPYHVEKHEEYVSEDGSEFRALINVYSSGKGTAYDMGGGYTGRSARLGDGSKVQMWYDDENRLFEIRYFDPQGSYHRDQKPAHLKIDHDHDLIRISFYVHGKLHNEEQAAVQEFSAGKLALEEFYLDGVKYLEPREWYRQKRKR